MLPKHMNPSEPEKSAHAPYNFVPLNDKPVLLNPEELPDQDCYDPSLYTGQIVCTLTTETPLFVRAPMELEEYIHYDPKKDRDLTFDKRPKNKPDFFYSNPADREASVRIPGSSLRGMLRTLVEILSYAKFEKVTERNLIYRSIGDTTTHGTHYREAILTRDDERSYTPHVHAGYLVRERGDWVIYAAKNYQGTTFARISHAMLDDRSLSNRLSKIPGCKNASSIYIAPGPYKYQPVRGGFIQIRFSKVEAADARPRPELWPEACTLAISGKINSKASEAVVFPLDPNGKRYVLDDELLATYRDQISQEQIALLGNDGLLTDEDAEGQEEAVDGLPKRRQPVFYLLDEQNPDRILFFGHTMMMRLPYQQSIQDLLPSDLRKSSTVDMAKALFGYISTEPQDPKQRQKEDDSAKQKARAYASRVMVGDACLVDGQHDIWLSERPFVPKILSNPKPTAFQHYLVQRYPDPIENGRTRDGRPKVEKRLADYDAKPVTETTLRGYKYYWHKAAPVDQGTIAEPARELEKTLPGRTDRAARDSQYTQIKPLRAGVQLRFAIRFENLSPWELGALLWAIALPGEGEGNEYRHKLGMGKPLGMGSVHLAPTLLLEDRQARYRTLFTPEASTESFGDGTAEMKWATGATVQDEATVTSLIQQFESYLLPKIGEKEAARLAEVPRISALFKLLAWPGPDQDTFPSNYMPLGAYRQRNVLPTPISTGRAAMPAAETQPTQPIYSTERPPREPRESAIAKQMAARLDDGAAVPAAETSASNPSAVTRVTSREEIQPGLQLEAKVVRVETNRIVVDLFIDSASDEQQTVPASLVFTEVIPRIRDRADAVERFAPGETLLVWVTKINSNGNIQTSLRPQRKRG